MTAPRIARTGVFRLDAIMADVFDDDRRHVAGITNIGDDYAQARELHGHRVTITIEPADAPAPGDALDYLAELKGVLTALVLEHAAAPAEMRERVLRRALNLANTASNAVLAERRAAR